MAAGAYLAPCCRLTCASPPPKARAFNLAYINLERTAIRRLPALLPGAGLRDARWKSRCGRHLHRPRGRAPGLSSTAGCLPPSWTPPCNNWPSAWPLAPPWLAAIYAACCAAVLTTTCPHNCTPKPPLFVHTWPLSADPPEGIEAFSPTRPRLPGPLDPRFSSPRISMTHRDVFIVSTARTAIGTFWRRASATYPTPSWPPLPPSRRPSRVRPGAQRRRPSSWAT